MSVFKGKSVLIRADAAPEIGTGHIMRTLVLADLLREQDAQISYACRSFQGSLAGLIKDRGYEVRALSPAKKPKKDNTRTWLGAPEEQDVDETFQAKNYDLVIVDHYGAEKKWFDLARPKAATILAVDDEARRIVNCDILLNQNYFIEPASLYRGLESTCVRLIGPEYALLRPEFVQMRQGAKPRTSLKKLLIVMGGSDPAGIGEKIARTLTLDISATIIVGSDYKYFDAFQDYCKTRDFTVQARTDSVASLMRDADFCIGAGGSTTWERCCLRLPSALFAIAENQRRIIENLAQAGACYNLGSPKNFDFSGISDFLLSLRADPAQLEAMSQRAGALVDGGGAQRVVQALAVIMQARNA